jgi:hypothetical protein
MQPEPRRSKHDNAAPLATEDNAEYKSDHTYIVSEELPTSMTPFTPPRLTKPESKARETDPRSVKHTEEKPPRYPDATTVKGTDEGIKPGT